MKDGTYIVKLDKSGIPSLNEPLLMIDGYWVADDSGVSVHGKLDHNGITDALSLMEIEDGEVIGIWENNGLSYIDRSYHFSNKDTAIKIGKVFNQIAIYDCANSKDISLV